MSKRGWPPNSGLGQSQSLPYRRDKGAAIPANFERIAMSSRDYHRDHFHMPHATSQWNAPTTYGHTLTAYRNAPRAFDDGLDDFGAYACFWTGG